ncbi:hypothetical protein ACJJTC_007565 [Scirpophaga incertulas]
MPHTCVFGCRATDVVMHVFPNPNKFPERFKSWVSLVGGDLQMLTDSEIYEKKRICDIHFSDNHRNRFKRLSVLAIPSLHLPHTSTGQHADPGNHDQLNVYHVATSSIGTPIFITFDDYYKIFLFPKHNLISLYYLFGKQ